MHGCARRKALGCALLLLASCVSGDHRQARTLPEPVVLPRVPRSIPLPPTVMPSVPARDTARKSLRPPSESPRPGGVDPAAVAALVQPPRGIHPKWRYIVIHHSATPTGNAQAFHIGHLRDRGWSNGLGYHFVIGNGRGAADGAIEVGPRWRRQMTGAHCSTTDNRYNKHGIGICLVGNFEVDRPTARQMASLETLVRHLCRTCRIPPENVRVHGELKDTLCPGRHFSLAALKQRLARTPAAPLLLSGRP